jgi:hypothetical protein
MQVFFSLFVLVWILYAFFILYHFIRFGIGRQPKVLAFWFLVGSFFILNMLAIAFFKVDWNNLIKNVSNIF